MVSTFAIVVASGGLGLLLLFLVTGVWRRTKWGRALVRPRKRSPLRQDLLMLRPAGHSLRERIDDASDNLLFCGLFSVMIPYLGAALYGVGVIRSGIQVVIMFGLFSIPFLVMANRLSKRLYNYRLGLDGELATAEELNQLMRNGYYVFHDFPAVKFNIDHIVIGPTGVFAVETKMRSKRPYSGEKGAVVKQEGSILHFPEFKDSDSVKQASDQAKWLSRFLTKSIGREISVIPIVAVPGWFVERGAHDGSVLVYNPTNGGKFITNRPTALDDQTIQQVKYQVEQRCRDLKAFNPL
jgi:hypothetical protein